jgi:DNA-binding HxlR family transcriptional regulator/ribosomal protein S14
MTRQTISPTDAIAINAMLIAVRQAADVICDRWVLMLISAALLGERRFGGFMQRTGMGSRVVTARLRTLETLGLFGKVPYQLRPLRHEYRLSVMGEAFLGVVLQMIRWEQLWPRPADHGVQLLHVCTKPLQPDLRCAACGRPATIRDVDLAVSRAQLRQIPPKQTLHRRMGSDGIDAKQRGLILGQSLDIFGDKWTVEVLTCAFFRVRRFGNFRASTGISANILSDRLERLIAAGIFRREARPSDAAGREYRLTAKGLDLFGTLIALQDWADAWVSERYRSPVRIVHRDCGQSFHAASRCGGCGLDIASGPPLQLTLAPEAD